MKLQKQALDIGIVTVNVAAMLHFYADTLGLPAAGEVAVPGGIVHKLQCGDSLIKLLALTQAPAGECHRGGFAAATGYRYCTLTVADLDAAVERCRAAGCTIAVEIVSPRPGLRAAMVEDPDGNTVELMALG
jgi:catechol 2,3-dioxygenase-like lactoylglutathione lyase family enzyme